MLPPSSFLSNLIITSLLWTALLLLFCLHFNLFQYSSKLAPLTILKLLLLFLHSSSSPKLNNKIKSTKLCILPGCWKLGSWTWKPDFFSWSLLASPSFSTLCCQPHFSSSPSHQKLKLQATIPFPPVPLVGFVIWAVSSRAGRCLVNCTKKLATKSLIRVSRIFVLQLLFQLFFFDSLLSAGRPSWASAIF